MLDLSIIEALEKIVGGDHVTTEPAHLICYSYDATQQSFLPPRCGQRFQWRQPSHPGRYRVGHRAVGQDLEDR